MSSQVSQLGAFISAQRGRAMRFELFRKTSRISGSKFDPIRPYDFEESTGVDELAQLVVTHAQDDANEIGAGGAYILTAENEAGEAFTRKEFRIASTHTDSAPLERKGGDELGEIDPIRLLAESNRQLMRHIETRERTAQVKDAHWMKAVDAVVGSYQNQLDRLASSLEKKEEREIQVMETFEKVLSAQHDRELATLKAKQRNELAERTLKQVEPAIPAIINKIMGVPIVPFEAQESFDEFLFSMTPEQLDVIRSTLTPEQQGVMGMMATESAKRRMEKEARRAAKNAAANGETKPEQPEASA